MPPFCMERGVWTMKWTKVPSSAACYALFTLHKAQLLTWDLMTSTNTMMPFMYQKNTLQTSRPVCIHSQNTTSGYFLNLSSEAHWGNRYCFQYRLRITSPSRPSSRATHGQPSIPTVQYEINSDNETRRRSYPSKLRPNTHRCNV